MREEIFQLFRSIKFTDGGSNSPDGLLGHFRIKGQGEDLVHDLFSDREISFFAAEAAHGILKVDGHRVMDACPDASFLETSLELIPARSLDDIHVIDMLVFGEFGGCYDRETGEKVTVRGQRAAGGGGYIREDEAIWHAAPQPEFHPDER